jgi:serine/threonine-protein kinase
MIEFRTLSGLSLRGADGRELHALLARPKGVALLAYLTLAPAHGLLRRDTLLALFWPESDESHARAALRKTLYVLRGSLGDAVLISHGDDEVGVDPRALWCDAVAFARAVHDGALDDALALYHGELLPGFIIPDAPAFEEWLTRERARLERCATEAAATLASRAEARGELSLAAHRARRALALSPDDESVLRRLITLLDRLGDRTDALRVYEHFARRLEREYEVQPSAETASLVAAIRSRTGHAPAAARAPRRIIAERYEMEREVARGGVATTFAARDVRDDRPVLVKVLRPELAAALDAAAFTRALLRGGPLRHPCILPIDDAGAADAIVYYVTPLSDGEPLRDRLARQRELPVAEAIRVLCDVAGALAHAHTHGILHHDLKPSRIVLGDAHAMVTDTGVAPAIRLAAAHSETSSTGFAMGTPGYTAPELVMADALSDHRADIYALGAVAYALLAGRPPVSGTSPQEMFAAQVLGRPVSIRTHRPAVSRALEAVVMHCLEKRPSDRPQTAAEVRHALAALSA